MEGLMLAALALTNHAIFVCTLSRPTPSVDVEPSLRSAHRANAVERRLGSTGYSHPAWMPLADGPAVAPSLRSAQRTEPSMARLYRDSTYAQKSIVADTSTVLGAPSARLDNIGMPQYALLVTLFTLALSASGRPATVVL